MNIFNIFKSTEHWYIRLIQWPIVIIFYSLLIIMVPIMIAIIAITWPFYNWDSEDN